jgi:peptidoglycan/LPS O-acetylase OafA/YrhL
MSKIQSNYFPQLTGIRAIAAYMVFVHHFNFIDPRYFGSVFNGMAKELHIGVTFFFVLSGFLIAFRYSNMELFSFKKYMINRIARIYPVYFVLTVFTFFAYNSFSTRDWTLLFLNLSFIRGFFEQFRFSMIAQGWSLTVEETFYILAPIFFLFLNKTKVAFLVIPLLSIAFGITIHLLFNDFNIAGFFGSKEFVFNYTFFGRATEFTAGMLLAYIIKSDIKLPRVILYFGITICILSVFILFKLQGNGEYDFGIRTNVGKIINTFILPFLGIVPLYYGLIKYNSLLSRLLSSSFFQILGKSSYVFYLIHMGIIHSIIGHYVSTNIAVNFILTQIISIAIWHYFEEPVNLLIRKKFTLSKSNHTHQGSN